MIKNFMLALFMLPHFINAQATFLMPETGEQVIEACNGTLYDAGGEAGDYTTDNEGFTLIQATDGDFLELTFTQFDLEDNFDFLVIFTGSELDPQVIGQYSGSTLPNNGNPILVNSNEVGIFFSSDFTINGAGFAMDFICTEFTDPPISNASFPAFTCQGGVQFSDISIGFPNSWSWDFGDGNTSTEQNPLHTYTTPGIYSISLIACNDNGCDTFTATDALEFNTDDFNCTNGVVMEQFGTITTNLCSGIFFDPGGAEGDYPEGSYSELVIAPPSSSGITLTFSEFNLGNLATNHDQLIITDPATGEQLDAFTGDDLPNAGQPITYDVSPISVYFYADHFDNFSGFSVLWQANGSSELPVANIGVDNLSVPLNTPVNFTDNSENNPGIWNWNFGDGNTSSEQNPTNIFTQPGTYEVSLNVSNCAGSDDAETVIITVQEAPEITVNPTSFEVTLDAGTTSTDNLNLCNIGAGDLNLTIQSTNSGGGFGYSFAFTTNENAADFSWQLLDIDLNIIQQSQEVFEPFQTYNLNFSGLDGDSEYVLFLNSPEGVQALGLFYLLDPTTGEVLFEQILPTGPQSYYTIGLPAMGSFSEWLSTTTSPPLISADNCEDYTVSFDATDLNGGVYNGEITIATNDPNNPFITIPVIMTVIGTPEIAVTTNNLDFGDIQVGGSSILSFTITNDGTDVLNLNDVASSQTVFDLNTAADFNLNPGESRTVEVTFTPTDITSYSETISIGNNVGADVEVTLTGNGIAAPFLTIDPTEFILEMIAGQDTVLNVNIGNIGEADLNFDIQEASNAAGFLFTFTTDFWGSEFSWNVTNSAGQIVQNSVFGIYGSNTTYTEEITGLSTNETYTLNMFDSFGDGALSAYSIVNLGTGQVIDEGDFTTPNNPFELSVSLGIPTESFVETTPNTGVVGIDGNQILDIYLDTEGLATGTYEIVVTVLTNDPLQPTANVTITLFVIAPVVTDFSASPTFVCGNIPVQFTDETENVATSWTWDFGDGTTATTQNPTHIYTENGSYTVSLIACNSLGCETEVKTDYITVETDCYTQNIPPEHLTETITVCEGNVYDSGGPNGDYLEGNNGTLIIAPPGATSLTITFSEFNYEEHADYLYVYDGQPFTGTLLASATGNELAGVTLTSTTGVLTLIESTGHFVQLSGFAATFSCDADPVLPVADFSYIGDTVCVNEPYLFFDESGFAANNWTWDFGDGSTSTLQNPVHNYTLSGVYQVTFTACNDDECDTYIEDLNVEVDKFCFQDSIDSNGVTYINNCFGTLYDSGGSDGNYLDNSQGIFTILSDSGSIQLTFTEFDYDLTDLVFIYDGSDFNSPILGVFSGSDLPPVINSTGPAVTIAEFSDDANNSTGFALDYLCSNALSAQPLLMVFNETPCDGQWNFAIAEDWEFDSYTWNFGDGTTSTEANPVHEFPHAGNYEITLTACLQGNCETRTANIYSNKLIPEIDAPAMAFVNQEVQLHGLTEAATHWEWELGNGETADHNTPTTVYTEAGIYDVHVHLTNINVHETCTATHTHTLNVVEEGTTATNEELRQNIRVFPNPMTDNLTIDFVENVSQTVELRLRTIDGKIVFEQPYENTIDVSELPAGSYFLEVMIEGETPQQFKVMKQ